LEILKNSYCCVVASEKIQKKKKHGSYNHVAAMGGMASLFLGVCSAADPLDCCPVTQ
jgi:hypothetical protein